MLCITQFLKAFENNADVSTFFPKDAVTQEELILLIQTFWWTLVIMIQTTYKTLYFYLCMLFVLCDSPSLSTCKLEILNIADPLSLAIGDWTSSAVGIGSVELYNTSISATILPGENELKIMPRKPRLFRYSGSKNTRNLLLKFPKARLRLFCSSGTNGSTITITTANGTVSSLAIVARFPDGSNNVASVPDSGGVSVE